MFLNFFFGSHVGLFLLQGIIMLLIKTISGSELHWHGYTVMMVADFFEVSIPILFDYKGSRILNYLVWHLQMELFPFFLLILSFWKPLEQNPRIEVQK